MNRFKIANGFTLIELLVSMTIIIMLTLIGFVNFRTTNMKSRNSKREADIAQVRAALEIYRSTYQEYPSYPGSDTDGNFVSLVNNSTFNVFLSTPSLQDPLNYGTYVYTYQSSNSDFEYEICYYIEPDGDEVCNTNP